MLEQPYRPHVPRTYSYSLKTGKPSSGTTGNEASACLLDFASPNSCPWAAEFAVACNWITPTETNSAPVWITYSRPLAIPHS